MPNPIKYSASPQTLVLKKGNFWIGTGDSDKGPTQTTGYWNGITPATGGYSVYINRPSGEFAVYNPANDSELITVTRNISGTTFATGPSALNWYNSQTDYMCLNIDYPPIVTNGLVLNLDAGFTPSYSRGGTGWYDVGPSGNNGTLINGPTFATGNGGAIAFDGVDDIVNGASGSYYLKNSGDPITINVWIKPQRLGVVYQDIITNRLNTNYNWILYQHINDGSIQLHGSSQNKSTYIPTVGVFVNITATVTTSKVYTLYVNGNSYTSLSNYEYGPNAQNQLTIGNGNSFGSYEPFLGSIAIAQIYSRSLTASEVLQNYQAVFPRFLGENIVTSGMVAYYDAGYSTSYGGTGTSWYNVAGTPGGTGALINGPTYATGNGGALVFDGSDDYVNLGNLQAIPTVNIGTGDMSVSIWVKPTALVSVNAFFYSIGSNQAGFYGLGCYSNGRAFFATTPAGAIIIIGPAGQITTNNWFNLVGTRTNGTIRLYVNGNQSGSPSVSSGTFNSSNSRIGINPDASSEIFKGNCGIFSIYSRALSPTEVLQNYNAQKSRFGL